MRSPGSAAELERRQLVAVQHVLDGYPIEAVADILGLHRTTVSCWVATFRTLGTAGLVVGASPGRPRKLTSTQEKIVLRWLADDPTEHGFPTSLWTADRLGQLIELELNVSFNP
jgi:transposase